jgi:NAD-dependent deacetylase
MEGPMRRLILLSGSGISADSGLDTFRSSGGKSLWAQYDPDIVCNFSNWRRNFDLVHEFYSRRRLELADVTPNAAHKMAASWQRRFGARLITQNVDDLFERAGAREVLHVHGLLTALRCLGCDAAWDFGYRAFDRDSDHCPECGSLKSVKPAVVFFNEPAPAYAEMWRSLAELTRDDLLVVIGTSGQVLPIEEIAHSCRAVSVLSNLQSERSLGEEDFDHVLHGRAAEIAPQLDALVTRLMER